MKQRNRLQINVSEMTCPERGTQREDRTPEHITAASAA